MWIYKHISIKAFKNIYIFLSNHSKLVLAQASKLVIAQASKLVIAQTFNCMSNEAHKHKTIWAMKHLSTHASSRPITFAFKHNHQSIWAYKCATAWLLKPPRIETYYQPSVFICVDIKYVNIKVCEHVIFKTCGIVAYDQQGMWAWQHVIIKVSTPESM